MMCILNIIFCTTTLARYSQEFLEYCIVCLLCWYVPIYVYCRLLSYASTVAYFLPPECIGYYYMSIWYMYRQLTPTEVKFKFI